jgi:hypothetical protein
VHDGYGSSTPEGLVIIDMSPLPGGDPVLKNQLTDGFNRAHNIFIDEPNSLLYAVGSNSANIVVYDLSNKPDTPSIVFTGSVPGGYVHDIYVENNIAYASSGYDGIYMFDFSTPSNPEFKGSLATGAYNHSSWLISNNQLLYAEELPAGEPLGILDISDPSDMEFDTLFRNPLDPDPSNGMRYHNPYVIFPYAFISSYHDGVTVFNIDESDNLYTRRVGYYDTNSSAYSGFAGCWGVYPFYTTNIFRSGQTIMAASDMSDGLYILDFNFVALPIQVIVWDAEVIEENQSIKLNYQVENTIPHQKIEIQKMDVNGDFVNIDYKTYIEVLNQIDFSIDKNPVRGENIYRLKISSDEETAYSDLITINYKVHNSEIKISPNPILTNQELQINISGLESRSKIIMKVFNSIGQLMTQKDLTPSFSNTILTPNIPGSYFVKITKGDKLLFNKPLIVK